MEEKTQTDPRLKRLTTIWNLMNEGRVAPADFKQFAEVFVQILKNTKEQLDKKVSENKTELNVGIDGVKKSIASIQSELNTAIGKTEGKSSDQVRDLTKETADKFSKINQMISDKADMSELDELAEALDSCREDMPEEMEAEEIRDELESLEGDRRLDISAIKGWEEFEGSLKKALGTTGKKVRLVGGTNGIFLYVDGVKLGITKSFNLKAGTGVTLGVSIVNGLSTITINSTGGGGFTELVATGVRDSSNTDFTFLQKPSYIVADGIWLKEFADDGSTVQWNWNVGLLKASMVNPPTYSIFGVA